HYYNNERIQRKLDNMSPIAYRKHVIYVFFLCLTKWGQTTYDSTERIAYFFILGGISFH
ncbi:IS3 family transposase, partial [Bacillus toyonensis]|uniref:IS3 family transposase n=1 Tax=Bacillus toyonensis TaxID=155322 RepID=UPI003D65CFC5